MDWENYNTAVNFIWNTNSRTSHNLKHDPLPCRESSIQQFTVFLLRCGSSNCCFTGMLEAQHGTATVQPREQQLLSILSYPTESSIKTFEFVQLTTEYEHVTAFSIWLSWAACGLRILHYCYRKMLGYTHFLKNSFQLCINFTVPLEVMRSTHLGVASEKIRKWQETNKTIMIINTQIITWSQWLSMK
jgi:hypothetical protein